jgi:hypothetical protein
VIDEQANAPRQPRRWRHCEARRVAVRDNSQSRAQIPGRASGVVLHAVVRLRLGFLLYNYEEYLLLEHEYLLVAVCFFLIILFTPLLPVAFCDYDGCTYFSIRMSCHIFPSQ